eukprot:5769442-Prymnesium_polylepis.1
MLALRPMALRRAARCAASQILPAEGQRNVSMGEGLVLCPCAAAGARARGRACVVCLYRP